MSSMNYNISDRISEEAHSYIFPATSDEIYDEIFSFFTGGLPSDVLSPAPTEPNIFFEDDIAKYFADPDLFALSEADVCDHPNSILGISTEPNELDQYLRFESSANAPYNPKNDQTPIYSVPVCTNERRKKEKSQNQPISLSQSVGVGQPQLFVQQSRKIDIVSPLEETFRPRYKSDYFAQSGKNRRPRYVADRNGNHYITIQVNAGIIGRIRIDWLTIATEAGDRYSMPYRFQASNEQSGIPDCNPLYVNIDADHNGKMKLYLVLIKSKQDELKSIQSLKPFHPLQDAFGIPDKHLSQPMPPMMPKQLIQKYQLDKSQLAFTYCALAADGQSPIPEWDTTVYSTVLSETPPESSRQKIVSCPNCAQSFPITIGNPDDEPVKETPTVKRKQNKVIIEEADQMTFKKQRSFSH